MVKKMHFKEAALLAQETAAAKEEGKIQSMLFAILQNQHSKQIAQMEATNKANMDAMMEQMNDLVAAGGGRQAPSVDKDNNPPGGNVTPPCGWMQSHQEIQEEEGPMPQLQNFYPPHAC
jgi:hypothetical protein